MADGEASTASIDLERVREEAREAVADELGGEAEEAADVDITEADIEHAHDTVLEHGLTTTDFVNFRAHLLQDDYEPDEISELWAILKNEGMLPKGEPPPGATEPSGGAQPDHDHDHDHDEEGFEDVGDLELEFEEANAVYLIKTANCPSCRQVEEALSGWIEDGVVTPINYPDNNTAETIAEALNIREVPALVAERTDGSYKRL